MEELIGEKETEDKAKNFASLIKGFKNSLLINLIGNLGVGKTTFVRGLIQDPKKKKPNVNLLWKLAANKNGSFLILDLEIEFISLVSSKKAEAMSILRKNRGNFDILLKNMTRDK